MTAEVIVLDDTKVEEMRRNKVLREQIEELELEPVAGLEVLSDLTNAEISVFNEICILQSDLEEQFAGIRSRTIHKMGEDIRQGTFDPIKTLVQGDNSFYSDSEAEDFFYNMERLNYLNRYFWFSLRERLQTFATQLTIRAGYRVCLVGRKYHIIEAND